MQVVEHWLYSLFFCVGELWGGVVISVLFWSLANEVCTVSDAKLVYPLMGVAANVALVVAGNYMKIINRVFTQVSYMMNVPQVMPVRCLDGSFNLHTPTSHTAKQDPYT